MREIEEGMVLKHNTSEAYDPIARRSYGKHVEKLLVEEITPRNVILYNFYTGKREKIEKSIVATYIRYGIFEITNERA